MSTHVYPLAYQIEDQQMLRKACYAEGDIEYGDYLLDSIKDMKSSLTRRNIIQWNADHS